MIRTGAQYRDGLRDGREVWIDGERVNGYHRPSRHSKPIVDIRARMYDMQHEAAHAPVADLRRETTSATRSSTGCRASSRTGTTSGRRVDAVMNDISGVVTRVGDETVGEMWSLYDGRDVLNEIDPQFGDNIARHIQGVIETDVFHVSANTDPKGDRSKAPQDQDPDMMVHVVRETDAGIVDARRQVRDRVGLCRPGLPQADGRRLDQREALRLCGRLHRHAWARRA